MIYGVQTIGGQTCTGWSHKRRRSTGENSKYRVPLGLKNEAAVTIAVQRNVLVGFCRNFCRQQTGALSLYFTLNFLNNYDVNVCDIPHLVVVINNNFKSISANSDIVLTSVPSDILKPKKCVPMYKFVISK